MTVELISVGTEILLGNIVNTNAAYLAGYNWNDWVNHTGIVLLSSECSGR